MGTDLQVRDLHPKNFYHKIEKLKSEDDIPFDLLLLADETIDAIEKYIYDSDVYLVKAPRHCKLVAVFVLHKMSSTEMEIKNIAVAESLQGKGIGSYLITEIGRMARAEKFESILVGTPDSAWRQIQFYEKNGFTKYELKKDFFIKNYSEPIIENGVVLRDMLMLKLNL